MKRRLHNLGAPLFAELAEHQKQKIYFIWYQNALHILKLERESNCNMQRYV